ncbi:dTMP kinase [Sulfitobacter sp. 1A13353]|uniref:dTMP kinase n=1 Tax=Sulfitobacter sp. 1A13353 TaxID=3368568 RepID=UPI003744B6F5
MDFKGKFITFEGGDGCGKSTQAKLLVEALREKGYDVVHTREPGGSSGAEEIRSLILTGDADRWSPETELLLFNAARRDHLERTIKPALEAGKVVICDRFVDSSRVYQGLTRGDLRKLVDDLHALMIGVEADLTVLMDIDPEEGLRRGLSRIDAEERFESFGLSFQKKVHDGFRALEHDYPERVRRVDGSGTPEEVLPRVISCLENFFAKQAENEPVI